MASYVSTTVNSNLFFDHIAYTSITMRPASFNLMCSHCRAAPKGCWKNHSKALRRTHPITFWASLLLHTTLKKKESFSPKLKEGAFPIVLPSAAVRGSFGFLLIEQSTLNCPLGLIYCQTNKHWLITKHIDFLDGCCEKIPADSCKKNSTTLCKACF